MTTLTQSLHGALIHSVRGAFAEWREDTRKRAAYRDTRNQLAALSDRELDDLGVARWEIDQVARRSVYGR